MLKRIVEGQVAEALKCYHCGQDCDERFWIGEKVFCCFGCKTVYEILSENNLCEYYSIDRAAGISPGKQLSDTYAYLDVREINDKLLTFKSAEFCSIRFYVPSIHCASCIWLLENLHKIEPGVIRTEVNFPKKSVSVDYNPGKVALSRIAALLSSLGYQPEITVDEKDQNKKTSDKTLVLKVAIAAFCFGNVMLFSFPEYLGLDENDRVLMRLFSWLNVALSVPVLFYCASDYFTSSLRSFRQRMINIDVPIALGLLALFARSSYDIITATGPGYLDSFTGLVFFLLVGRWFQSKTYESMSFDRDFRSYFPLSVNRKTEGEWKPVVIHELREGDMIQSRNMEIIPADGELISETAYIDYSFVTGESRPVKAAAGDLIYAGGRVIGKPAILKVLKKTSQSHLTSLWNHSAFRKVNESKYQKIIDRAGRRFTWVVLGIALATAVYWQFADGDKMWLVLTSVLMVACPCALALAAPFTYGSMLREFGNNQLYLKNTDVVERLAGIDAVVFDKTGTVTTGRDPAIKFIGNLSADEWSFVKAITAASSHPLSILITKFVHTTPSDDVTDFVEYPGKGIKASANGKTFRIGSTAFCGVPPVDRLNTSIVAITVDDEAKGYFTVSTQMRKHMKLMLTHLDGKCAGMISGDNDGDRASMEKIFPGHAKLLFNQSAHDKLDFIRRLQKENYKVLMIGDGLNDAGAFKQSDVGIAVSDNTGLFSPACDGILAGDRLEKLNELLRFARSGSTILKAAFAISFFYNAISLTVAVTGHLTPLIAAIIMPVSSVSVVGFSTLAVRIAARKLKK